MEHRANLLGPRLMVRSSLNRLRSMGIRDRPDSAEIALAGSSERSAETVWITC